MNVSCAECASVFRIDPAKVPGEGVRARCSVCGAVIAIAAHPTAAHPTAGVPPVRPAVPALGAAAGPVATARRVYQADAPAAPPAAAPPAAAPPAARSSGASGGAPGLGPSPAPAGPRGPEPAPDVSGRIGPRITPRAEPARPGSTTPTVVPAVAAPTPPYVPSTPAPPTANSPAGGAAAAAPSVGPRRFNPYLSNDPSQKARRLARALVSDLVAYQPQKREEGLRAGNLKELFRDEIRKSWEEYVAQVGAPVAESTTHFQDALNDVLAGGRKIF